MVTKAEFVQRIRAISAVEPSKEQWCEMYEMRLRDSRISDAEIIKRVVHASGVIDRRRKVDYEIVALETLAEFGRTMHDNLRRGIYV